MMSAIAILRQLTRSVAFSAVPDRTQSGLHRGELVVLQWGDIQDESVGIFLIMTKLSHGETIGALGSDVLIIV
jgi:hypothetical protein